MAKIEIDYNKIYDSNNYGKFKILSETKIDGYNRKAVKIQFIATGTIKDVPYARAINGSVKDVYFPKILGIACIGNASCYNTGYRIWSNMIHRCYDINNKDYESYGGAGVRVCKRWHCFEYFLNDLPFIDGYTDWMANPSCYHLDKDYKQQNIPQYRKIYSLHTCCFLLSNDNISLSDVNNYKYTGLEPMPGNKVRVRPRINNIRYNVGVFDNPEAAANAYNNFMIYHFKNKKMLNNVQYMSPAEVMKYNLKPKEMCKII